MDSTKKNPNPQGKGMVPLLGALAKLSDFPILEKEPERIENELFTSLFVLSSEFKFQPVIGHSYSLYFRQEIFHLSPISPRELGGRDWGVAVGLCKLHTDLTWSLELSKEARAVPSLMELLNLRAQAFSESVRGEGLSHKLPFFTASLPFHQRVMAYGLARSLHESLKLLEN